MNHEQDNGQEMGKLTVFLCVFFVLTYSFLMYDLHMMYNVFGERKYRVEIRYGKMKEIFYATDTATLLRTVFFRSGKSVKQNLHFINH